MTLDALASPVLHLLARASIAGAIALAAACLLAALSRSGRIKSWWLRLAHLKLALALLAITPLALPLLPAKSITQSRLPAPLTTPAESHSPQYVQPTTPAASGGVGQTVPSATPLEPGTPDILATTSAPFPATALLLTVWLLGATLTTAHLTRAWRKTRTLRQTATPLNNTPLTTYAQSLAHTLHLRTAPQLLLSNEAKSPFLTGLLRPAIILPATLATTATPRTLELILAHELAHLARRDLWWNLLPAALSIPFFFHPLLWLARREWLAAQEIACDQLTLAATNAPPADYARTLLEVITRISAPGPFAAGMGTFATTKRRINAMRHPPSKSLLAIAALAIVAAVGLTPWRLAAQSPGAAPHLSSDVHSAPSPVTTEVPSTTPPAPTVPAQNPPLKVAGNITADTFVVTASVQGNAIEINVTEGQHVKRLDHLLRLDDSEVTSAHDVALIEFERAQAKFNDLSKSGAASQYDIQEAKSTMTLSQIALFKATQNLDRTQVVAPVDGVVSRCDAKLGQFVSKGAPLVTIVDTSKLGVAGVISQDMLDHIHVGQKLKVAATPYGNTAFSGKVTFISPVMDPTSGGCQFKGLLDPDDRLKPGMYVTIELASN
ncbi:MAG: efflux RND transporter periplasmic adaptor subunit [Phycisphaerae bacterium]